MTLYQSFFSSSGTCRFCGKHSRHAIKLRDGSLCCSNCCESLHYDKTSTEREIRKIEARENSWWAKIGKSLSIVKSRRDELESLHAKHSALRRDWEPIDHESRVRNAAIKAKKELRDDVCKRANYKCQKCGRSLYGSKVPFHVHHVKPRSEGGDDGLENLQLLCEICHSKLPKHGQVKRGRKRRLADERKAREQRRSRS